MRRPLAWPPGPGGIHGGAHERGAGAGLIGSIYDGIQRPLDDIMELSGNNLHRGVEVPALKRDRQWEFVLP